MENVDSTSAQLNQTMVRHPDSVWNRRGWNGAPDARMAMRLLIGVSGAALAVQGFRFGAWRGRTLAALGSSLSWWAMTGRGDLSDARRWFMEVVERRWWPEDQQVTRASADSFPASDSPSCTPTMGTGVRRKVHG